MESLQLEWGKIVLNMLLVFLLVFLNALFVSAEFALVKIRRTRLQELVGEGNKRARYAMRVTERLDTYLSACQLGITLTSLGLGWVGEPSISNLIIEPIMHALHINNATLTTVLSFFLAFLTITFLHIVVGEQAPKQLAIQRSEATSLLLAGPLILFNKIFSPAIVVLNKAANGLLRLLGVEPTGETEGVHTEEEIRIMMTQSAKSGQFDKDEMVLFDNIFEFSDRLAREVMLPRIDIDCLYTDVPMEQNLKLIYETKHTRYPVAVEDKDRIVGFVHITDLLTAPPQKLDSLSPFIRPIITVPESMEISDVLQLMQKKHSQLAIVVDEYGGTAGLLTAEDILEEIVGEMQDEFDNERPEYEVKDNVVSVDGRMLIEELAILLTLDLEDDEVDSIGGWVFKKLEGVPAKGKRVEYRGFVFEVEEVDRYRIVRVRIQKPKKTEPAAAAPEQT